MKVAFMHAVFPGLTSSFINREYEFLKTISDLEIVPFSIKRPSSDNLNQEYKHYVQETNYLKPDCITAILLYNFLALFTKPFLYWKAARVFGGEMSRHNVPVLGKMWFHFVCGVYLGYRLRKENFAAIHTHFNTAANIGLAAHLFSKLPYYVTYHASDDLYTDPVLLQSKLHHAAHVITNNRYNEMHLNLLTGYRYQEKITVIYNGVDLEQFAGTQNKPEPSLPLRLLSVGSFTGCKGYPTVLQALHKLKQNGINFRYSIIGGGNSEEKEMIERLITRFDLTEQVVLLGRQPFTRVRKEMEETDIFIMASEIFRRGIRDGFPNVIIEAMLLKRPVISTYISDIPNIIQPNFTGYLFPEKNVEALTSIIQHLYYHYTDTVPVVERAHNLAIEKFDAKKNYQTLVKIICASQTQQTGSSEMKGIESTE
jgi:glycosyltransferase involved in cell wall biosynthesis